MPREQLTELVVRDLAHSFLPVVIIVCLAAHLAITRMRLAALVIPV